MYLSKTSKKARIRHIDGQYHWLEEQLEDCNLSLRNLWSFCCSWKLCSVPSPDRGLCSFGDFRGSFDTQCWYSGIHCQRTHSWMLSTPHLASPHLKHCWKKKMEMVVVVVELHWRSKNSGFSCTKEEGKTVKEGCPDQTTKPQRRCRKLRQWCGFATMIGKGMERMEVTSQRTPTMMLKEREDGAQEDQSQLMDTWLNNIQWIMWNEVHNIYIRSYQLHYSTLLL